MRLGTIAVAVIASAALALSGCSTAITGTAQVADPKAAAGVDDEPSDDPSDDAADGGDLALPGDDPSDLEGLLGGLGDVDMPDLDELFGGLTDGLGDGEMPDLGQLFGGLADGLGDEGLSNVPGLADLLGSECLTVAGASMSIGMMLLGPAMGAPLTQDTVDKTFDSLSSMPSELAADIAVLREAASNAVGATGNAAQKLIESPEVETAMDHLSDYLNEKCDSN